jgi:rod shape-determining protein MreD
MDNKAHSLWVVALSFFVAYLLAVVPVPVWAMSWRPEWLVLVLIYWIIALPYRIGIGSAWSAGLLMDVLEGSVLGLNAMVLAIIAYITLSLHKRLRMFSVLQQSGLVFALVGLNLMMSHWLRLMTGQTENSSLLFLLAALTSALIWPLLFQLLRDMRRSFDVR